MNSVAAAGAGSKFSADLRSRFGFTPTEAVVAVLLTEGLAYSEIAERLHISYNTVHTHTKAIHRKAVVPTTGRLTALLRVVERTGRTLRPPRPFSRAATVKPPE